MCPQQRDLILANHNDDLTAKVDQKISWQNAKMLSLVTNCMKSRILLVVRDSGRL